MRVPKKKEKKVGDNEDLDLIRKRIRSRYERPTLVYESDVVKVPLYPTRFPKFNAAVGGGIPGGAVIEIYGPNDSTKSAFATSLAADIQKTAPEGKKHVVLLNYERRKPWRWWRTLGLDVSDENFTCLLPRSLEEGNADLIALVESNKICCVVIDSVFAASSREGREAIKQGADPKAKKASLGVEARVWGAAWTPIVALLEETDTVCIAVNQIRNSIDIGGYVKTRPGMPKPTTTPRGEALKFYAWFRLEMRAHNLDPNKWPPVDGVPVDGRHARIKVIKNGINDARRDTVEMDILRGVGWDLVGDLLAVAQEAGIVEGTGNGRFEANGQKFHGVDRVRRAILDDPAFRAWIEGAVASHLSAVPAAPASADAEEPDEPTEDDSESDEE